MEDKDKLKNEIENVLNWGHAIKEPQQEDSFELLPELNTYIQAQHDAYSVIRQDTVTNKLARLSSKSGFIPVEFTNTARITTSNGSTDLTVIIKEYANVTLKPSTSKLLRALVQTFTQKGDKLVKIPLKEYMELTGLKNEKEARKTIKADLDALHSITCEAKIKGNKNKNIGDYIKFEIISERGIKNKVIFANLTDSIYIHLLNCPVMYYPKALYKIPNKLPYAQYLGDKIAELEKYNMYDKKTGQVKPYFIASVRKLLQVCFENGMPSYEKVQATDRAVERRIITPFENSLDVCADAFCWEYCNSKRIPLTTEQTQDNTPSGKYRTTSYKEFIDLYIKITPKNYPTKEIDLKRLYKKDKQKQKPVKK